MSTTLLRAESSKASKLQSLRLHIACELKVFWSTPVTVVFIVAMPIVLYAVFGFAFKSQAQQVLEFNSEAITAANRTFAGVLTFAIISVAFANVGIGLAIRRTSGVYRRLRTSAASPAVVLLGFLAGILTVAILVVIVVTAMGTLFFRVAIDAASVPALLLGFIAALIAFAPLGIAISLIPASAETAVPLVNGVFFPLAFFSGAFFNLSLGSIGDTVLRFFPARPVMNIFAAALYQHPRSVDPLDLAVLAGWALIGVAVSARWFRWSSEVDYNALRRRKPARTVESGR